jgi:hypothetical protein
MAFFQALCRSALMACCLAGCTAQPAAEPASGVAQAIVGGEVDLTLPAVGWISRADQAAHVCSATLVDPRWVLTAAHCVVDEGLTQGDFHVLATDMTEAARFRFSEVVPHQRYDRDATALIFHDLALLHLDEAVPPEVATPLALATPAALGSEGLQAFLATDIVVMGSGAADPGLATDGITRRASVRVASIERSTFTTLGAASGTCFGDSGGPALATVGERTLLIGVHSTVFSARCDRDTSHTRVDVFADWILSRSGQPFTSCASDARCACTQACQSDGVCDDARCGSERCGDVITCLSACDLPPCRLACADDAAPDAIDQANTLAQCHGARCAAEPGADDPAAAYLACAAQECPAELSACDGLDGDDVDAGAPPGDAGPADTEDAGGADAGSAAQDAGQPLPEEPVGLTRGGCSLVPPRPRFSQLELVAGLGLLTLAVRRVRKRRS